MKRGVPALAALLCIAVWTASAGALGLAEIDVRSHLNQRFDASIPLTSVTAEEAASLRVRLADADDYARAGLPRGAEASLLRFAVRTDGAPRIEVSSTQPLHEPYVQMLVEVSGGGNRVLRQYSALLDPPEVAARRAATVARAQATPAPRYYQTEDEAAKPAPPAAAFAASPAPAAAEAPPAVAAPAAVPAAPAPAAPAPAAPTPAAPAPAGAATPPVQSQRGAPAVDFYGPVKPGETLWSIAERMRGDRAVSMDQALLAIYNSNPRAFEGRFNGLMKGSMLRVPSEADMRAVDAEQASIAISRLRRGLPQATRTRRPQLDLGDAASPSAAADAPAAKPAAATPPAAVAPVPAAPAAAVPAPPADAAPAAAADVPPPTGTDAASATPAAAGTGTGETGAVTDAEEAATAPASQPPAEPQPSASKPPRALPPPPAASDTLVEDLLIPLLLLLLLIALIGVLAKRWRRRRGQRIPRMPELPPKPLTPRSAPDFAAAAAGSGAAAAAVLSAQDDFERTQAELADEVPPVEIVMPPQPGIDVQVHGTDAAADAIAPATTHVAAEQDLDFALGGGFDLADEFAAQSAPVDMDALDPLSEAEFHSAHGLLDEAVALLERAAAQQPDRDDVRAKLALAYLEAGRRDDYKALLEKLQPRLPQADYQALLLAGGAAVPVLAPEFTPEPPLAEPPLAAPAPFDAVLDAGIAQAQQQIDDPLADALDPVEFQLEEFEVPAASPDEAAAPLIERERTVEFDLGDFDIRMPEVAAPATQAPVDSDPAASVDFDLSGFDLPTTPAETPTETGAAAGALRPQDTPPFQIEDFDFDALAADSDPISGDESGTKLDLARAYVDMGDNDMARGLLDEVLQHGSDAQRLEARQLLGRLG